MIAFPSILVAQDTTNSTVVEQTDTLKVAEIQKEDAALIAQMQQGNLEDAEKFYNEGVKWATENNLQEAKTAFGKAINANTKMVQAYFNRGNVLLKLEDEIAALNDFNKVIELAPQHAKAFYLKAQLEEKNQNFDEALSSYEKAAQLDSAVYEEVMYRKGVLLFQARKYRESISAFTRVIERNPMNAQAYNDRGSAKRKVNDFDNAIYDYSRAIEINPSLAIAYANRAGVKRENEDFEGALKDYGKALELEETNAMLVNNRGDVKFQMGDYVGAVQDFTEAIKVDPKYTFAYNNRGYAYYKLRKYKESINDYDKAIELDAEYGYAYLNRGISKEMLGDFSGACSDWTKAGELGVQNAKTYTRTDCNLIK